MRRKSCGILHYTEYISRGIHIQNTNADIDVIINVNINADICGNIYRNTYRNIYICRRIYRYT